MIFNVLFFTGEAVSGFILHVSKACNKNSSLHGFGFLFFFFFIKRQLGSKHYCSNLAIITNFSLSSLAGEGS